MGSLPAPTFKSKIRSIPAASSTVHLITADRNVCPFVTSIVVYTIKLAAHIVAIRL